MRQHWKPPAAVAYFALSFCLLVPVVALMPAPAPPVVPNPALTPGATLPVTAQDVCVPGYSQKVRNVPAKIKALVYLHYGITRHTPGQYEVDHLISLELGGSNDLKNLWPEAYHINCGGRDEGAHVKDRLEDRLHALVCSGALSLKDAQAAIRKNWLDAYKLYVGPLPAWGTVKP